jgi:hypothetical protein
MSELSVEGIWVELVARVAANKTADMYGVPSALLTMGELRALIRSWRQRGEALKGLRERIARGYLDEDAEIERIDTALGSPVSSPPAQR